MTLSLTQLEDVIFVPRGLLCTEDLLYDRDGNLIVDSALHRGLEGRVSAVPDRLPDALYEQVERRQVNVPTIFLGTYDVRHYGHWLTEGLARCWALTEPAAERATVITGSHPYGVRRIASYFVNPALNKWRWTLRTYHLTYDRFVATTQPLRCRHVLLPQPSMRNEIEVTPEHFVTTQRVGAAVVGGRVFTPDPRSRVVYLSRSRLGSNKTHHLLGEAEFERRLLAMGVHVVYPERLTFKQQIRLFSSNTVFMGSAGSAFHTLLVRQVPRASPPVHCVYLAKAGVSSRPAHLAAVPSTIAMIDELLGCIVHTVPCLAVASEDHRTLTIDVSRACELTRQLLDGPLRSVAAGPPP